MKKILCILLITGFSFTSFAEGEMTFGQLVLTYFDELLPVDHITYTGVDVKYTDVPRRTVLDSALQKAVYHDMFPNASIDLGLDRPATVADLAGLLQYHFGVQIIKTSRQLTIETYDRAMNSVRGTYSYQLMQSQNALLRNTDVRSRNEYEITQAPNFDVLERTYKQLRSGHFDAEDINDEELIYGAAHGIAEAYDDPHTSFLEPVDVDLLSNDLSGNYAGIGAYVEMNKKGHVIITGTLPDSPARAAGLRAGDRITHVDGVVLDTDVSLVDVVSLITGEPGTQVRLTIEREDVSVHHRLTRAFIEIPFVEDSPIDVNTYLITLYSVGSDADEEFREALERFKQSGSRRLILDLRDNPGGTLGETRVILDTLIPIDKRLITIQTKEETYFMYSYEDALIDLSRYETIVLINGGTASAAEIIAGSMEDYFPGTVHLLGEKTYGKGSVQQVIALPGGSGLKYTTAKWFTGRHRVGIDGTGISPEYEIPFREDLWEQGIDVQLEAAKILDVKK